MKAYFIKRLILLIPATLFALVITFFLTTLSSPQSTSWDEERRDRRHPRKIYQDHLQQIKTKGSHLPVFYFSLVPTSVAWTMDEVDPVVRKGKKLWVKKADHKKVRQLFRQMDRYLDTVSSASEYRTMMALKSTPPESIPGFLDQSSLDSSDLLVRNTLELLNSKATIAGSLPKWLWHGSKNRFHQWAGSFITGDWGTSVVDGRPASRKIWSALIWTLGIAILTILGGLGLSYFAAIYGLTHKGTFRQRAVHAGLLALYAMPLFWIATMAIVFLTTPQYHALLNIFPSVGIYNPTSTAFFGQKLFELFSFIFLPILCMILSGMAYLYLQWLENGRSIGSRPFILTAKSKGLKLSQVVRNHIMPNASIPVIGLIGLMLPSVISGSVIIEVLFNIPGMGRLIFTSIMTQDWNIVFAVVFLTSILSFLGLALSDLLMHYWDPKIRVDE